MSQSRVKRMTMPAAGIAVKVFSLMIAICVVMVFAGNALAVPPGKTVEWSTPDGKVIFDGKTHADKGLKCGECHTKTFKMKQGADKMTMAEINSGKFCGECHNGEKAFKAGETANCGRCHKK